MLIYHDDAAEVYVNGHPVEPLPGADNHYRILPLSKEASDSLKVGDNLFAVHCHNVKKNETSTPGFVDFGVGEIFDGKSTHK